MTVTIKKSTICFWVVMFILQVVIIAHLQGLTDIGHGIIPEPVPSLEMSNEDAVIVLSAIGIVRKDLTDGDFDSAEKVIDALSANIPTAVRAQILKVLGTPSMENMQTVLDDLEEKVRKLL